MGRIRPLYPEFWDDERLLRESKDVGRAFQWLWGAADDAGRVPLDAWQLKRGAFSVYPDTVEDCDGYIGRLLAADRLWPYEADGQRYAVVRTACKRWRPSPKDLRAGGTWRPAPPVDVLAAVDGYRDEMGRLLRGAPDLVVKGVSLRAQLAEILWPYPGDPPDVPWWSGRPVGVPVEPSASRPEDIHGTSSGYPADKPPQVTGSRYQEEPPKAPPAGGASAADPKPADAPTPRKTRKGRKADRPATEDERATCKRVLDVWTKAGCPGLKAEPDDALCIAFAEADAAKPETPAPGYWRTVAANAKALHDAQRAEGRKVWPPFARLVTRDQHGRWIHRALFEGEYGGAPAAAPEPSASRRPPIVVAQPRPNAVPAPPEVRALIRELGGVEALA